MVKEIAIKINIDFPEYEDLKLAIMECKRRWDNNEFKYISEVTYNHILCWFPGGSFRIYAGEDTHYKPTLDEMHGIYLHTDKKFELNKKGYKELVEYAIDMIKRSIQAW